MSELKLVKLHFRSPVHLGSDISGVGLEAAQLIAHSDTIFSCLTNAYAELYGIPATSALIAAFQNGNAIPLRLSSGFPFCDRRHGTTYFLPKPHVDPPDFFHPQYGKRRKQENNSLIKEMIWISIMDFQKWRFGAEVSPKLFRKEEYEELYSIEVRPQHARDRLTDASSIYHTGLVHFVVDAGLYFLVELNPSVLSWSDFEKTLQQAGRNGLGGRRSAGNGIFEAEIEELTEDWSDLTTAPNQDAYIILSLYYPQRGENLEPVAYGLVPRRGWTFSSVNFQQMKRRSCMMFSEGSIFRNQPVGGLADVTPMNFSHHGVYRFGFAVSLPFKVLGQNHGSSSQVS